MPPRLRAALFTLSAVTMWGLATVGNRVLLGTGHDALPPSAFIGLRYGLASLLFLPWLVAALRSWSRRDLVLGAALGVLGVTGYNLPNAWGSAHVSAGMVGLINAAEPLFIMSIVALRSRTLPRPLAFGAAALGVSGIALLAHSAGPAQGDLKGILLCLLGAFDWAAYCVFVPALLARHSSAQVTAITLVLGTLPMLAAGTPEFLPLLHVMTGTEWLITLVLAIGPSALSMVAWNVGAAGLGAEASGWFLYLLPVISVGAGAALLGEPLSLGELAGGALIMVSVFVSQRA